MDTRAALIVGGKTANDDQETDFLEDTEIKPKKQLSEQKLQHLANIRVKALEKKKEMKQMTEKVNELKKIDTIIFVQRFLATGVALSTQSINGQRRSFDQKWELI